MKRKKIYKISLLLLITTILAAASYCVFAQSFLLSDRYTVIEGGTLKNSLPYFISADNNYTMNVQSSGKLKNGKIESRKHSSKTVLKFLGVPIKAVSVNVIKSPLVSVSGECIGVKLRCDGLITVGVTDFKATDGSKTSPAKDAGIRAGDIIKSVDGTNITSISQFLEILDLKEENCTVTIERNGKILTAFVCPQKCADGHNRIGIWVRDSVAGIGTMTFTCKDKFASLGHGISDSDTDVLIPVKDGTLHTASILGISKGKKGAPGEIIGALNEGKEKGYCEKNLESGIYGSVFEEDKFDLMEIAPSSDVQKGKAAIICTTDDSGPKEYEIQIQNISRLTGSGKSMIIKITDPALLAKTGGIVQGMSGSPIIQNNKLVGAITHVFVNDPQKGYAIFAQNMIKDAVG